MRISNTMEPRLQPIMLKAIAAGIDAFQGAEHLNFKAAGAQNRFSIELPLPDQLYGSGTILRLSRLGDVTYTIRPGNDSQPIVKIKHEDPGAYRDRASKPSLEYALNLLLRWQRYANSPLNLDMHETFEREDAELACIFRGLLSSKHHQWVSSSVRLPHYVGPDELPCRTDGWLSVQLEPGSSRSIYYSMSASTMTQALLDHIESIVRDRLVLEGSEYGGSRSRSRWHFSIKAPREFQMGGNENIVDMLRSLSKIDPAWDLLPAD